MVINSHLSEENFKEAYAIHYSTLLLNKLRPVLGLALLGMGIHLILSKHTVFGVLCIIYSPYFFLAKWLFIRRLLRHSKGSKTFGKPVRFEIKREGQIHISSAGESATMHINDITFYVVHPNYLFLYPQKSIFYFFKNEDLEAGGGKAQLLEILKSHSIKEKNL